MYISRNRKPCFQCKGTGKEEKNVCRACGGYGSPSLRRLEDMRRKTNEGTGNRLVATAQA
jgi:DnaJ-class molecular chaperone